MENYDQIPCPLSRSALRVLCCICLDETNIKYEKTICCNNYIHKSCFLTWLIYNGDFCCCLCRQKPKISIDEIMNYDINNTKTFNIDKQIFIQNLNNIVNESISFIVNISENTSENTNENLCMCTNIKFKKYLTILLIPVFYIILFYLLPLQYQQKYQQKSQLHQHEYFDFD